MGALTMPGADGAGVPPSTAVQRVPPASVSLWSLKQQEAAGPADAPAGVELLGVARGVPETADVARTQALLPWVRLPDGRWSAALRFASAQAHGLRLGVRIEAMPAKALVRVFAAQAQEPTYEADGATVLAAAAGTGVWWSPDAGGDAVELQWVLPPGVPPEALRMAVPSLSHIVRDASPDPAASDTTWGLAKSQSTECVQDAMCSDRVPRVRNAVVRMAFVIDGNTYGCTGVLVNNARQDWTPYVLTAGHCVHDQAVASTLQMSWFYQAQSCDSMVLNPASTSTYNGADWLATSAESDMTLLRLHDAPPVGAVFAGWERAAVPAGSELVGLHHPRGTLLKVNTMALLETAQCSVSYGPPSGVACQPGAADGGFYRAEMESGSIEPGSSGSPVFHGDSVVGTLTGGDFFCPMGGVRVLYGRLDRALQTTFAAWLEGETVALASTAVSLAVPTRMPVYQFYLPMSGANFFTIESSERDFVIEVLQGVLEYQGVAFYASAVPASGLVPVYRFFHPDKVAHFYTASADEKASLESAGAGWRYERIAWYVPASALADTAEVFRLYDHGKGVSYYTLNATERDWLQRPGGGFEYNGVAYYVWPAPAFPP
ncbi:trypsin-like peptidase domain-containing protein [Comamonas humi]